MLSLCFVGPHKLVTGIVNRLYWCSIFNFLVYQFHFFNQKKWTHYIIHWFVIGWLIFVLNFNDDFVLGFNRKLKNWRLAGSKEWLWTFNLTIFIDTLSNLNSYWLSNLKYMAWRPLVMFSFMRGQMVQYWTIFKLCLKLCFVYGTLLRI